ncbi:MAG: D-glycero-beta-D-manno-heptose-7-phosphate kinase, partial [Deltaproteobacteria bacterium]|nr:D-glycero-beta-D-manno-heptose-7-phosphate kinase [Deltaproteobacteria bacterium]
MPKQQKPIQTVWPIHAASWDKKKLDKILKSIAGARVLVIGDVGVDRYTIGLVERISPEAPV